MYLLLMNVSEILKKKPSILYLPFLQVFKNLLTKFRQKYLPHTFLTFTRKANLNTNVSQPVPGSRIVVGERKSGQASLASFFAPPRLFESLKHLCRQLCPRRLWAWALIPKALLYREARDSTILRKTGTNITI